MTDNPSSSVPPPSKGEQSFLSWHLAALLAHGHSRGTFPCCPKLRCHEPCDDCVHHSRLLHDAGLGTLEAALASQEARHRQEMEEAKRALDAEQGKAARYADAWDTAEVEVNHSHAEIDALEKRAEAAEQREREAGARLEVAIKALCNLCHEGKYPVRPGKYRPNEWWHDVGDAQLPCKAAAIRCAPSPVSAPPTDSRDDLLEFAWGVVANAGGGDWTKESAEWQEAAARFRTRWHTLIGANARLTPVEPGSDPQEPETR